MNIDLTKLTVQELKNLLANQLRLERPTKATVVELARRGAATGGDYLTLRWNQASVCDALRPFKDAAAAVVGNRRTTYTSKLLPSTLYSSATSGSRATTPNFNCVSTVYALSHTTPTGSSTR
jgi:hypothetical protein